MGLVDTAVSDGYLVGLAVLDLLSELATESLLLVVAEDAHWLDHASAETFAFVARRLDAEPVVLLAALRDGVDARLRGVGLPELRLEALSEHAAEQLLARETPNWRPSCGRAI
jgi:predicted ATPase